MIRHHRPTLLTHCILSLAAFVGTTHAAVTIEKVIPIATDRQVRIQVQVKSDRLDPIDLQGKILPVAGGAPLWEGSLGTTTTPGQVEKTLADLQPQLWSPGSPNLYNLVVTAKQTSSVVSSQTVRFGFRSFTSQGGHFLLNGHPIFLAGIAINPPDRDIPAAVGYSREFARAYVKYLRSQHVNLIRMTFEFGSDPRQQIWFDACDELGMMVDQGDYGAPPPHRHRIRQTRRRPRRATQRLRRQRRPRHLQRQACHPRLLNLPRHLQIRL